MPSFYDLEKPGTFGVPTEFYEIPGHTSDCLGVPKFKSVVPNVGGTAPWGAVGLPRWALIGTRGERERCYYHRGALVDK